MPLQIVKTRHVITNLWISYHPEVWQVNNGQKRCNKPHHAIPVTARRDEHSLTLWKLFSRNSFVEWLMEFAVNSVSIIGDYGKEPILFLLKVALVTGKGHVFVAEQQSSVGDWFLTNHTSLPGHTRRKDLGNWPLHLGRQVTAPTMRTMNLDKPLRPIIGKAPLPRWQQCRWGAYW